LVEDVVPYPAQVLAAENVVGTFDGLPARLSESDKVPAITFSETPKSKDVHVVIMAWVRLRGAFV